MGLGVRLLVYLFIGWNSEPVKLSQCHYWERFSAEKIENHFNSIYLNGPNVRSKHQNPLKKRLESVKPSKYSKGTLPSPSPCFVGDLFEHQGFFCFPPHPQKKGCIILKDDSPMETPIFMVSPKRNKTFQTLNSFKWHLRSSEPPAGPLKQPWPLFPPPKIHGIQQNERNKNESTKWQLILLPRMPLPRRIRDTPHITGVIALSQNLLHGIHGTKSRLRIGKISKVVLISWPLLEGFFSRRLWIMQTWRSVLFFIGFLCGWFFVQLRNLKCGMVFLGFRC